MGLVKKTMAMRRAARLAKKQQLATGTAPPQQQQPAPAVAAAVVDAKAAPEKEATAPKEVVRAGNGGVYYNDDDGSWQHVGHGHHSGYDGHEDEEHESHEHHHHHEHAPHGAVVATANAPTKVQVFQGKFTKPCRAMKLPLPAARGLDVLVALAWYAGGAAVLAAAVVGAVLLLRRIFRWTLRWCRRECGDDNGEGNRNGDGPQCTNGNRCRADEHEPGCPCGQRGGGDETGDEELDFTGPDDDGNRRRERGWEGNNTEGGSDDADADG